MTKKNISTTIPNYTINNVDNAVYKETARCIIENGCQELNLELPENWKDIPLNELNEQLKEKAEDKDYYKNWVESDLELLLL